MKKLVLMLSVAGIATFALTSCNRDHTEEPAIEQTIKVQLATNEAYTFVLPKNKRDDVYEFTTQASHYSISTIGKNASGEQIYQYTPALNYSGTDQVIVSNDWEKDEEHPQICDPQGPPPGQCGANEGPEEHFIVTFNFEIGRSVLTNSK